MAITINWGTKVINVPQADLTPVSAGLYELDVNAFRLALKDLEDSEEGAVFADTHVHSTTVTLGGVTLARVVEIINGYTITFQDGQYAVRLAGANNNIADVMNVNQVSLRSNNSAGLIVVETGAGANPWETNLPGTYTGNQAGAILAEVRKLQRARMIVDTTTTPWTGKLIEEGTGTSGAGYLDGTVLRSWQLYDITGTGIVVATTPVARQV